MMILIHIFQRHDPDSNFIKLDSASHKPLLKVVPIDSPTKVDATIKFLGHNFHF